MSEEAESEEGDSGETGRAFVLALIPLVLLLLLGLYGPLIEWVLLQSSLPVTGTDRQIAALLFGGYLETQYGVFLLVLFGVTAGGGAGVAWLGLHRAAKTVLDRKFLRHDKSGLRFLILILISTIAAFGAANFVAILSGATTGFVIPFGYFSAFSLALWTGTTAGICAFATAVAVLALHRWGLGRVPDPGFPNAFFARGERRLIELKPRLTPFLLRALGPAYVFLFFLAVFALSSGGSLVVTRAFFLLFGIPLAFFVGVFLLVSLVRWRATYYAVTDRRIMSVTGLVGHAFHDMRHGKVQNVTLSQNAFQKWRGYGTITFASAGTTGAVMGNIVFIGVPEPIGVRRRSQNIIDRSQDQVKERDYRKMAETFKEVEASPLPRVRTERVVTVTERKSAKFCEYCGAAVQGVPKFCEECGNRVN